MDEKKPKIRKRVRPVTKPISEGHDPHKPVGYKNPPKPTQFQKGQSGNPSGRPKGRKNFETVMREQLNKPVTARVNGRIKKVSTMEAMIMQLLKASLEGDKAARALALKLSEQFGSDETSTSAGKTAFSREDDAKVLQKLLQMQVAGEAEEEEDG